MVPLSLDDESASDPGVDTENYVMSRSISIDFKALSTRYLDIHGTLPATKG